jgi:hypothetical protein
MDGKGVRKHLIDQVRKGLIGLGEIEEGAAGPESRLIKELRPQ